MSGAQAVSGPAAPAVVPRPKRRQVRRVLRGARDQALPWISLGVGLVVWEIVGRSGVFPFVPAVSDVAGAWLVMLRRGQLDALGSTLQALAIGFAASLVLGIATGIAMARNQLVEYVLDPYIDAFMTIPSSALIPIYLVLFGLGTETRVVVVFMHAYFVVVVNTVAGARGVEENMLEMARSFGANESALIRKVVVPAALPIVITGIRLGLGRAIRGVINGETILASVGIGQLLIRYGRTFQMDYLYGVVMTIVLLSVLGTTAIGLLERSVTRWQRT